MAALIAAAAMIVSGRGGMADEPVFEIPVDCAVGETCFVQNYVDIDPGPGARDFMCGTLTYDGHKGTDFRIPDLTHMARGVAALAAAPGTVSRVRDSAPDGFPDEIGAAAIEGMECGNGVVIDHGNGWETQYCHLRKGSVAVTPGTQVAAGDPIGLVGLSGKTEFAHLHLSIRHNGQVIDPYVGAAPPETCGEVAQPLWSAAANATLAYRPSGMLNAGFTAQRPTLRGIEQGEPATHPPGPTTNLIFYVRFFGLQAGDRQRLRITDPTGAVVVETDAPPAEKNQAQWMQFLGRRALAEGWPPGPYHAHFELVRDGVVVLLAEQEVEIR